MNYELPYNECYAVISTSSDYDTVRIEVEIRNPQVSPFSSKYNLSSRWYISSMFDHAYGGTLDATGYSFDLDSLQSATKVLKKCFSKLDKINNKYGYTNSMVDNIMRILEVSGVKEVRIWDTQTKASNWGQVVPLNPKKDVDVIRYKLNNIYQWGKEKFPYKEKEN